MRCSLCSYNGIHFFLPAIQRIEHTSSRIRNGSSTFHRPSAFRLPRYFRHIRGQTSNNTIPVPLKYGIKGNRVTLTKARIMILFPWGQKSRAYRQFVRRITMNFYSYFPLTSFFFRVIRRFHINRCNNKYFVSVSRFHSIFSSSCHTSYVSYRCPRCRNDLT